MLLVDQILIKGPGSHTGNSIRESLEASLKDLGVEKVGRRVAPVLGSDAHVSRSSAGFQVNIAYLHAPDRTTPLLHVVTEMDKLFREGKFAKVRPQIASFFHFCSFSFYCLTKPSPRSLFISSASPTTPPPKSKRFSRFVLLTSTLPSPLLTPFPPLHTEPSTARLPPLPQPPIRLSRQLQHPLPPGRHRTFPLASKAQYGVLRLLAARHEPSGGEGQGDGGGGEG